MRSRKIVLLKVQQVVVVDRKQPGVTIRIGPGGDASLMHCGCA